MGSGCWYQREASCLWNGVEQAVPADTWVLTVRLMSKKQSCVFSFLHISVDLSSSVVFVNSSSYLPPLTGCFSACLTFHKWTHCSCRATQPCASSITSPYPHLHPHCSHTTSPRLFSCILCLCFRFLYLCMRCRAWQVPGKQCPGGDPVSCPKTTLSLLGHLALILTLPAQCSRRPRARLAQHSPQGSSAG